MRQREAIKQRRERTILRWVGLEAIKLHDLENEDRRVAESMLRQGKLEQRPDGRLVRPT